MDMIYSLKNEIRLEDEPGKTAKVRGGFAAKRINMPL